MKLLFGLLLLLCLVFFAFMQLGGVLTGANKSGQPQGDLNAEKVKLLDMPASKPIQASAVAPVQLSVAASAPLATSAAIATAVPAQPVAPVVVPEPKPVPAPLHKQEGKVVANKTCMEWGEFSGTDLARAKQALAELKFADRLGQRTVEYSSGYWVYIPPLKSKAAVNRKIEEIKAKGIEDYFVIQDSRKWFNAISLGVFKTEEAANSFQASLKKKGLRTMRVGERKSKLKFIIFVIKRIDAAEGARLALLQKDFANSELKTIVCNN